MLGVKTNKKLRHKLNGGSQIEKEKLQRLYTGNYGKSTHSVGTQKPIAPSTPPE